MDLDRVTIGIHNEILLRLKDYVIELKKRIDANEIEIALLRERVRKLEESPDELKEGV